MNKYVIEQKIRTLSRLFIGLDDKVTRQMIIDGFEFNQWVERKGTGLRDTDAWMVKKEMQSNTGADALNEFRGELDQIVQKVGFVSQCYMDFYKEPFLFFKLTNNPDRVFFYRHIREDKGVGLHFNNDELKSYELLKSFKHLEAFRFLQECRNTIGYIPKLLLLFSALEAMCGKIEKEDSKGGIYVTYDKGIMKKILGCSLYHELFGTNGIRHKLDHGELVDSAFGKNYVEEIYKNIVCYFNAELKTNISTGVVSPQRHFYDNQSQANLWLTPNDDFEVSLKNCTESCDENINIAGCDYTPNANLENY